MRSSTRWSVLVLLCLFTLGGGARAAFAAKCEGKTPCNACKNCSSCKHCAKDGGKCGVCKKR